MNYDIDSEYADIADATVYRNYSGRGRMTRHIPLI